MQSDEKALKVKFSIPLTLEKRAIASFANCHLIAGYKKKIYMIGYYRVERKSVHSCIANRRNSRFMHFCVVKLDFWSKISALAKHLQKITECTKYFNQSSVLSILMYLNGPYLLNSKHEFLKSTQNAAEICPFFYGACIATKKKQPAFFQNNISSLLYAKIMTKKEES